MYPITEPHPHRHFYRGILLIAFVLLSAMTLVLINQVQRDRYFSPPSAALSDTRVAVKPQATATFRLQSSAGTDRVTKSSPLTLMLYGDSKGRTVEGFDALISIEGVPFEVASIESADFDVIKVLKPGYISLIAVKKLNVKDEIQIYSTQPVVTLTLNPLEDGSVTAAAVESIGAETSKMILNDMSSSTGLMGVSATVQPE